MMLDLEAVRVEEDAAEAPDGSVEAVQPASQRLIRMSRDLRQAGKLYDAAQLALEVLKRHPKAGALWNEYGSVLMESGRYPKAAASFKQAVALAPHLGAAWANLGVALSHMHRLRSAVLCLEEAARLEPRSVRVHHDLGRALLMAGDLDAAQAQFEQALEIDPQSVEAKWARGQVRLLRGDYRGGFADYESRLDPVFKIAGRPLPGEPWDGRPFRDRTLLVVGEQGLGDHIWAARFVKLAKARGGRVILLVRGELHALFRNLAGVDELAREGDPLPAADLHCYMGSLPGLFVETEADVPASPYLSAEPERVRQAAELIARGPADLRVGIIWSGSPGFARNVDRRAPLEAFLDAFSLPGVQLYSLQKGPPGRELGQIADDPRLAPPVVDLGAMQDDLADAAAMVQQLDLVIMTDSSVAHLCGAMGRPIWLLLGRRAHWLWGESGARCRWYPSMRLFRQRHWDDWNGVFDEASAALFQMSMRRAPAEAN